MFVAGLNPFAGTAFSVSTMAIALPATAKVISWLATTWRSRPVYPTPMLFRPRIRLALHRRRAYRPDPGPTHSGSVSSQYLLRGGALSHLIMAMAGIFGLFAATYYWFPQLSSAGGGPPRLMNETLGRWHFWLTIAGAYLTFLPMHLAGLAGDPRHYAQLNGIANAATVLLSKSLTVQKGNNPFGPLPCGGAASFSSSISSAACAEVQLQRGIPGLPTTLEWSPTSSTSRASDRHIVADTVAYRGPCDYFHSDSGIRFKTQWAADEIPE